MNEKFLYDVVIVGGGPAGMSAALKAEEKGAKVCLIEREDILGGILNQCIHNGFGLHYFKKELTGTEFAYEFAKKIVKNKNITLYLSTFVIKVKENFCVECINEKLGKFEIIGKSLMLGMGCRERTAGNIELKGERPAGVMNAGTAQKFINMDGKSVGNNVVILGSGDIGLIMARRLTFEGAKVLKVLEIMTHSSGLKRNIVQCLNDFDIPIEYSTTVTKIIGEKRVEGIYYTKVDEKFNPIMTEEKFLACDTVLLSVGLVPENEIVSSLKIDFDNITNGAVVDNYRQTSMSGVFACGNVLHVHDLADNVTLEGEIAGESAALFSIGKLTSSKNYKTKSGNGIRYVLPQLVSGNVGKVKLFLRCDKEHRNKTIKAYSNGRMLFSKKIIICSPGEMESIEIDTNNLNDEIVVCFE